MVTANPQREISTMKASSNRVIANFLHNAQLMTEFSNHTTWHRRRKESVSLGVLPCTLMKIRVRVLYCRLMYPEEDMSLLIWFKAKGIRLSFFSLVTTFEQVWITGCGNLWSYQLEERTIWLSIQTFLCFEASGREVWSAWGDFYFDELARIWLGFLSTSSGRESWLAEVCHLQNLGVSSIEEKRSPTSSRGLSFLAELGFLRMSRRMHTSQYKAWSPLYRCGLRWLLKVIVLNLVFFTLFQIANGENAKEMESKTSRKQERRWRNFKSNSSFARFNYTWIPSTKHQSMSSRWRKWLFWWENILLVIHLKQRVHQVPWT